MIRGAIDYSSGERIGGWIYCDQAELRGRTVLAFLGADCVGAGKVEDFRQDLADAGLGDGYVGFNFGVTIPDEEDARKLLVRLEGSDLALMSPGTTVTTSEEFTLDAGEHYSLESIEWMRQRGWLDQIEFDFLKNLSNFGVYDRSLRKTRTESIDPLEEATRLMELYAIGPVKIGEESIDLSTLSERRLDLLKSTALPIVAFVVSKGALSILEGSHRDAKFWKQEPMVGAVEHRCSEDRLLFLDLRAQFSWLESVPARVFLAN